MNIEIKMSAVQESQVHQITAPAAHERTVAVDRHASTDILSLRLRPTDNKISIKKSLSEIMGEHILNCGNVSVDKIVLKCRAREEGDWLNFGCAEVGSSLTASAAAMKENGHSISFYAANRGKEEYLTLIPEDSLSRQVKPISADLPMMKIYISCSPTMIAALHIHYTVHGLRYRYGDLKV